MQNSFCEDVYWTLNDFYLPEYAVPEVENAFANGAPCSELYKSALDAYQRICDRLHIKDFDSDLEIIFDSFLEMNKIIGIKMYEYGAYFATKNESP